MSLHTLHHQGPWNPRSCGTFMLNIHWCRAAAGKKCLAFMHAGSLQSCPTLWDSVGCGLPGISVSGILQVRILDWPLLAAIPF